jgi:RimJ/RimL family protein N-acetyltransferase/GrpB-like predicted nucleotidyltransferase (UPF0157 family)
MQKIWLEKPDITKQAEFLAYTQQNESFHAPWTSAPKNVEEFSKYIEQHDGVNHCSFWILCPEGFVGVVNLSNIIRGCFQNAFLGYYGNEKFSKSGFMTAGIRLVLKEAFDVLKLHRIEASVQPDNVASIKILKKLDFAFESYSRNYLQINGKWCDHLKWALTDDAWRSNSNTHRQLSIFSYQQKWEEDFLLIKDKLSAVTGTTNIEHIGSTAVPGLDAKNCIDIQIGIEDLNLAKIWISNLKAMGLDYREQITRDHIPHRPLEEVSPDWQKQFFNGSIAGISVNVHVRQIGKPNWRFSLLVRDFLRSNQKVAASYAQLKHRLAELPIDGATYAYVKDPVADLIYTQAEAWAYENGWNPQ